MAFQNAIERLSEDVGAQALAASRSVRRGVGIMFHGVRGKGHGGAGIGLEGYLHEESEK